MANETESAAAAGQTGTGTGAAKAPGKPVELVFIKAWQVANVDYLPAHSTRSKFGKTIDHPAARGTFEPRMAAKLVELGVAVKAADYKEGGK